MLTHTHPTNVHFRTHRLCVGQRGSSFVAWFEGQLRVRVRSARLRPIGICSPCFTRVLFGTDLELITNERGQDHESDRTRLNKSTDFQQTWIIKQALWIFKCAARNSNSSTRVKAWLFPWLSLPPPHPPRVFLQPTVRKSGSRLLMDPSAPTWEERESLLYALSASGSIW